MVKDKYRFAFIIIFVLIVFYIAYLTLDKLIFSHQRDSFIKDQQFTMQTSQDIAGVILGGSNAFFSLKAEMLDIKTKSKWINTAISSEGHSNDNYWAYIEENLSKEKRLKVATVIYSPVSLEQDSNYIKDRFINNKGLSGEKIKLTLSTFLKPNKSVAYYIKSWLQGDNASLVRRADRFGDLLFSTVKCDPSKIDFEYKRTTDKVVIKKFVHHQLSEIHRLFPKSNIYFIKPSMFYGDVFNSKDNNLTEKIVANSVNSFNTIYNKSVMYVANDFYPDSSYICDGMHHANEKGREWRTQNLLEKIPELLQEQPG